jgi:hypothetical protein
MKMKFTVLSVILVLIYSIAISQEWTQIGQDVYGIEFSEALGEAVDMNGDGRGLNKKLKSRNEICI